MIIKILLGTILFFSFISDSFGGIKRPEEMVVDELDKRVASVLCHYGQTPSLCDPLNKLINAENKLTSSKLEVRELEKIYFEEIDSYIKGLCEIPSYGPSYILPYIVSLCKAVQTLEDADDGKFILSEGLWKSELQLARSNYRSIRQTVLKASCDSDEAPEFFCKLPDQREKSYEDLRLAGIGLTNAIVEIRDHIFSVCQKETEKGDAWKYDHRLIYLCDEM